MGVPTQTQIQNWSDRLAALVQLDLNGFSNELVGATNQSLWNQVDASTDPGVVSALSAVSDAIDRMSLPENYPNALPALLGRGPYKDWMNAANALVAGGAAPPFGSFQAYLNNKGATVHPLFAELWRANFGANSLDSAATPGTVTEVFPPNYTVRTCDRVYSGADGALSDITAVAASAATADFSPYTANNQALYFGSTRKFSQIIVALSTPANVTIAPVFQYWNGSSWATLTVTDNSAGFTLNDTVSFTPPSDWQRYYKDGGGTAFPGEDTPLYYIRIARSAGALATPPVGTCATIVPARVLLGSTQDYGVDQPPLILLRITGGTTITPVLPNGLTGMDFTRFKPGAVRFRALTPFSTTPVILISYLNQAGNAQTQSQAGWASPAALATVAVVLNGADTGMRSAAVTGWTVSAGSQGVIAVESVVARAPAL